MATRIVSHVDQVLARMDQAARVFVTEAGVLYVNEVKRLMLTSPRGGRIYRRTRLRGIRARLAGRAVRAGDVIRHVASAPGEPPAVDRGTLVNSVVATEELTPRGWSMIGGSTLPVIPRALEYGTRTIAPRPAFIPALLTIKPALEVALRRAFDR